MTRTISGQILLIICCVFYLLWWRISCRQDITANRTAGVSSAGDDGTFLITEWTMLELVALSTTNASGNLSDHRVTEQISEKIYKQQTIGKSDDR